MDDRLDKYSELCDRQMDELEKSQERVKFSPDECKSLAELLKKKNG